MNATLHYSSVALVGDIYGPLRGLAPRVASGEVQVEFCIDGRAALQLARRSPPGLWFIAKTLSDMSGFDCVDMLGQICADSRFVLVGDTYHTTDELRVLSLHRSQYYCPPIGLEILDGLLLLPVRQSSSVVDSGGKERAMHSHGDTHLAEPNGSLFFTLSTTDL